MEDKGKKESKFKFVTVDENGKIVEDNSILSKVETEEENMSFKEMQKKEFENKKR